MKNSHDVVRSLAAWCVIGPCAGALAFCAILYSPVLLGQSQESMVGWGWIAILPANVAGVFGAGIACKALLTRWSLHV